jgi:hypothetical protein
VAGRLYFATIGADLLAVWHATGGGLQARLDGLERVHGKPVRLLWSTPATERDAQAVHAELGERRVGDDVYAMTGAEIETYIALLKERMHRDASRRRQELVKTGSRRRDAAEFVKEVARRREDAERMVAEERDEAAAKGGLEALLMLADMMSHQAERAPLTLAELVALIDGIMARGITTVKGITRELNAQGIPARRGYGRWWPATVRALLREARKTGLMSAHTTSVT